MPRARKRRISYKSTDGNRRRLGSNRSDDEPIIEEIVEYNNPDGAAVAVAVGVAAAETAGAEANEGAEIADTEGVADADAAAGVAEVADAEGVAAAEAEGAEANDGAEIADTEGVADADAETSAAPPVFEINDVVSVKNLIASKEENVQCHLATYAGDDPKNSNNVRVRYLLADKHLDSVPRDRVSKVEQRKRKRTPRL